MLTTLIILLGQDVIMFQNLLFDGFINHHNQRGL
jgi:hypothetical protein